MQRLNVIEFDYLSLSACMGIVNDVISDVTENLTDADGPFKLKGVRFDYESRKLMAKHIFEDKILQGRARNKLEDKIYSLFSKDIGKDNGKNFKVLFILASDDSVEHFTKEMVRIL